MVAANTAIGIQKLHLEKDVFIAAPIDIAFECLLEELGPASVLPDGKPMPMVLEAFPGGRWFRDLGKNTGHLWAHVQVIKPPTLLELSGPLFMSYAAVNHVFYRLKAEGNGTRLSLTHSAIGLITDEHATGVHTGWHHKINKVAELAQLRMKNPPAKS